MLKRRFDCGIGCHVALAVALAGVMLAGCGKKADESASAPAPPKAEAKGYTIAVIPKGTTHEFWKSIHAGGGQGAAGIDGEQDAGGGDLEGAVSGVMIGISKFRWWRT